MEEKWNNIYFTIETGLCMIIIIDSTNWRWGDHSFQIRADFYIIVFEINHFFWMDFGHPHFCICLYYVYNNPIWQELYLENYFLLLFKCFEHKSQSHNVGPTSKKYALTPQ